MHAVLSTTRVPVRARGVLGGVEMKTLSVNRLNISATARDSFSFLFLDTTQSVFFAARAGRRSVADVLAT